VGTSDGAQLGWLTQAGEVGELTDIVAVGSPGFGIGDIGEPFELGRHLGEIVELGRSETDLVAKCEVFCHVRARVSVTALLGIPNMIMYFIV